MHKSRRERARKESRNIGNKSVVIGLLERAGHTGTSKVRVAVAPDTTTPTMQETVLGDSQKGSQLYSDEAGKKLKMREEYEHDMVNHLECYVEGNVHTSGIENFWWTLLKSGLGGTYISVEPFHLYRYVDEQAFRLRNRLDEGGEKVPDAERFFPLCFQIVGCQLTHKEFDPEGGAKALGNWDRRGDSF